ncbi:MAG TPA: signal recognition particle-docking protein FtsY [Cyanobacteria bacterium UBA8803]|nr:signal recognition particle-docking protein FtsY [Cyanobacteria bacterium UBA9273]HBL61957.1 signal recognition particle-docking protein FtsY [Cyanobacteria bacterium UBA8803]
MVFNWFRRQIGNKEVSSQETPSATPQVEPEQQATEQATPEQAPAAAEDYLSWAKAAYKNIQKHQHSSEQAAPEVTEPAEIAPTEEAVGQPEVTQTAQPSSPAATVEPEPSPTADSAESQVAAVPSAVTEAVIEEESAPVESVESIVTPPEVEATAKVATSPEETTTAPPETPTPTPEALVEPQPEAPEPLPESAVAAEAIEPEAQAEVPVSEEPSAPVPIWARQADRQERLKRLEATAIETPEPEPLKVAPPHETAVAATALEEPQAGVLAFDEGFLWSARVLASQGRSPDDISVEEISWLKRLREGLGKTRRSLVNQLRAIVGQGPLNQDAVSEIESLLLQADVGVEATDYIIETLQAKMRQEVLPPEQAIAYLKQILRDLLDKPCTESYSPTFVPEKDTLNIWLMTGVNGVGKTTTIGKLAHLANKSGYSCLIAAGDTFRAAAVEQVKIWGERSGTEVIANPGKNTDPAAVVFDAIAAAQSRNTELLLVDTAGRLQNKKNLMEELAKIRRIVDKKAADAKVESLLVLDATLGQNGLRQAEVFSEAAKLSGVVLTKLDGTAKGGVALAVVQQLGLPIRFIGAGEGIEDLRPFSSYEFVEALLSG